MEFSPNDYYAETKKVEKSINTVWDKRGQAVNEHCDILDVIHKVARYIDGFLLHSQNGCQICSTGIEEVPDWTQEFLFFLLYTFKSIVMLW